MNVPVAFVICAVLATSSARPFFSMIGSNVISGLRQTANTLGAVKSSLVQSGTDTFKAGVNMGAGMTSMIPGLGTVSNLGASVINTQADTVNSIAQGQIKTMLALENAKLDLMSSGLNMFGNIAKPFQLGSGLFSSLPGVSSITNIASSLPGVSSITNIAGTIPGVSSITSSLGAFTTTTTTSAPTTTTEKPSGFFSLFNNYSG